MGVGLWWREEAARRKRWPARFFTVRIPRQSVLPPLISLSGHRLSQEAKCPAVGHFDMSRPTSLNSARRSLLTQESESHPPRTAYRLQYADRIRDWDGRSSSFFSARPDSVSGRGAKASQ